MTSTLTKKPVQIYLMRSRGINDAFAFDHHFHTAGFTLLPPSL